MNLEKNTIIEASGGIVWKKKSGKYHIAVVKRKRYGDKWSLPKGKLNLNDNETWKEAAQREIQEEVGVNTRIIGYADTINYLANGIPKVVVFWHMQETGDSTTKLDPEVVDIKWITPNEAAKILDYREQRELVKDLKYPGKKMSFALTIINALFKKAKIKFVKSHKRERIENELKVLEYELGFLKRTDKIENYRPIYQELEQLAVFAKNEVEDNQFDAAWKIYHLIRRLKYLTFDEIQLKKEIKILEIEADKLNDWRKKAVTKIFSEENGSVTNLEKSKLIRATRIRDEHYDNIYYKNSLSRGTINVLSIVLALFIIFLFAWANIYFDEKLGFNGMIENAEETIQQSFKLVPVSIGVFLFGVVGGCISSLFHIRDSSKTTRLPELINNIYFTLTRVFIGGVSAVIILIFLESEFSQLLLSEISIRPSSIYTYLSIAFAAGFTERLLLNAVTAVVGKE